MIGVIADDLTGAAELAAVGWRHGLHSEVLIQGAPATGAQLVCADTDSRSCSAAEAARRVMAVARQLLAAGATWIYKKVDSVLRGPVVAELEALQALLNRRRVLLVPANPSRGRFIRQGAYWVQGRHIDATDFRADPEHPRRSPWVVDLLGARGSRAVTVCAPRDPLPDRGLIVGEADSIDDLRQWARRAEGVTLMAGAAEFFEALLALRGWPNVCVSSSRPAPEVRQGMLFVCGSTSQATGAFVARARQCGVPVISLPPETAEGHPIAQANRRRILAAARVALRAGKCVLLTVGLPRIQEWTRARGLVHHLAALAAQALDPCPRVPVFVEGGATAVALLRRLGASCLKVQAELAPGVVSLLTSGPRPRAVTVKPGSYSWPNALVERCAGRGAGVPPQADI